MYLDTAESPHCRANQLKLMYQSKVTGLSLFSIQPGVEPVPGLVPADLLATAASWLPFAITMVAAIQRASTTPKSFFILNLLYLTFNRSNHDPLYKILLQEGVDYDNGGGGYHHGGKLHRLGVYLAA